jgi:hypothetical protein
LENLEGLDQKTSTKKQVGRSIEAKEVDESRTKNKGKLNVGNKILWFLKL